MGHGLSSIAYSLVKVLLVLGVSNAWEASQPPHSAAQLQLALPPAHHRHLADVSCSSQGLAVGWDSDCTGNISRSCG